MWILLILSIISLSQEIKADDFAIKLSSNNQSIRFINKPLLDINHSNSAGLTIEMFVTLSSSTSGNLYSRYDYSSGSGIQIYFVNGIFSTYIYKPELLILNSEKIEIAPNWYHISFEISESTSLFFLNGKNYSLVPSTSIGMPGPSPYATSSIGNPYPGTSWTIDEVRISNILRYYSDFIFPQIPFSPDVNTVLLLHLNEGSGTTVYDSAMNNNGVLRNNPSWVEGYFRHMDSIPPSSITDLYAYSVIPGNIHLLWSSPGDDGNSGVLNGGYLIQYSTYNIVWNSKNAQIFISTSNVTPGSQQLLKVAGLLSGMTYYFRIWTYDEIYNISEISNQATCPVMTGKTTPPAQPSNLLCNGQINPEGLFIFKPVLSWTFYDIDEENIQGGYIIIVDTTITQINNLEGNIWNSGVVFSTVNCTVYNGLPLEYGNTYYWKVMVIDNTMTESSFSETAYFSMKVKPQYDIPGSHPYGVNSWNWPSKAGKSWKDVNIDRYRVMVSWPNNEPSDNQYTWETSIRDALKLAGEFNAKLSLCVFLSFDTWSPFWARNNLTKRLSVSPQKYGEFITALLEFCESNAPGVVETVEILNEEATGEWSNNFPVTNNTGQRDPSWYYKDLLIEGYKAVKSFNPDIKVATDGIWYGAYHHLDELYQLGLKDYFDRINLHHYTHDFNAPDDPAYTGSTWHFPTILKYLKYIAKQNNDPDKKIILSEFGWRISDEQKKSKYMEYVLDNCRKTGFVDMTFMYVGITGGWPNRYDRIALIYADSDWAPSLLVYTTAYYMYEKYTKEYPSWGQTYSENIETLPPASKDINIVNSGLEMGNLTGWENSGEIDINISHTGRYSIRQSAPSSIKTVFYEIEKEKLYEVIAWIKISAADMDACMVYPSIIEKNDLTKEEISYNPPNYFGIVDTRNYPRTWRRIRFMYLSSSTADRFALLFNSYGSGTFWIDDVIVKSLDFEKDDTPLISISPYELNFGIIEENKTVTKHIYLDNTGPQIIEGSAVCDKNWVKISPARFSGNKIDISVSINYNDIITIKENFTSKIIITTNGGNFIIPLTVARPEMFITVKPNPFNPEKGNLSFYGNLLIEGNTKIKIYTVSGNLIKTIENKLSKSDYIWDGKDENGKTVSSGIYIFTYESQKGKGTGKITLLK